MKRCQLRGSRSFVEVVLTDAYMARLLWMDAVMVAAPCGRCAAEPEGCGTCQRDTALDAGTRRAGRMEVSSHRSLEHHFSQMSVCPLLPSPFLPHLILLALGSTCWDFAVWLFSNFLTKTEVTCQEVWGFFPNALRSNS